MDVAHQLQQVAIAVAHDRFVAPLVQMPDTLVAPVVERGITHIKMPHELAQIAPWRRYHQVKVVAHEHIGVKLDPVNRKRSPQFFEEGLPVPVVAKDRPAVIAPARDVIISPGEQDVSRIKI